jgi:cytochrome d ubiquinol oxidase subunit I
MFSAVWIVVANSWQQTPAGYHIVGEGVHARAEITDFWAMVFNPSSVERLSHVWIGALLAGAFFVLSVNAYYIVKKKHIEIAQKGFKIALIVAIAASYLQLFTGHKSADGVAKNQPAKLAALEGHFKASGPADMYLLGYVDKKNQETYGLKIPGGLSFLLYQNTSQHVTGLQSFPEKDRPSQLNAIFQFYHIMVAIGMLLIALSTWAAFQWYRGRLFDSKWLMLSFIWAGILPQIANQVGWFAAEMGRQPWVVYGLLRTSDAFSKSVHANQVLFSIILFGLVYLTLFVLFIYLLNKKIVHGPSLDKE